MEQRRILLVIGSLDVGGAEAVARDIALYAPQGRFLFHYVVFGDRIGAYESRLSRQGCRIFHIPEPSRGYRNYIAALKQLIKRHRYHAVHAHTMFHCGLVLSAAKEMGVPLRIAHAHSAPPVARSPLRLGYETLMRHLILKNATVLAACSRDAGVRLFGEGAYNARGIHIPNGIQPDSFRFDPEKRQRIRNRYLLEDRFVLGHVGHLTGVKNQRFLLELMPRILAKSPNAALLLLGEGEDRAMLESRARELGLENRVIFTGAVDNPGDYLSAMDVFVFPSLYEGMPLALLEAQANGLPCVVSASIPRDGFAAEKLSILRLEQAPEVWAGAICQARRKTDAPLPWHLTTESSMAQIHSIYESEKE